MAEATITAAAVKELRQQTGAGMMDCKKALQEAGGDHDKAVEIVAHRNLAAQPRALRIDAVDQAEHVLFEIILRGQAIEPLGRDVDVAASAGRVATAGPFDREPGVPQRVHQRCVGLRLDVAVVTLSVDDVNPRHPQAP